MTRTLKTKGAEEYLTYLLLDIGLNKNEGIYQGKLIAYVMSKYDCTYQPAWSAIQRFKKSSHFGYFTTIRKSKHKDYPESGLIYFLLRDEYKDGWLRNSAKKKHKELSKIYARGVRYWL